MSTQAQREFNATPAGQRAMFYASADVGFVLMLNRKVKALGGQPWDERQITSANTSMLDAIKTDLITDYNRLLGVGG